MRKLILIIAISSITTVFANAQKKDVKSDFNTILSNYFDTKNALAKDDTALANKGAKNMLSNLAAFQIKNLSTSEQVLWKTQSEIIKKSANSLVVEKDLKEQRKSFWPLSTAIIKLAKELKLNNNEVYVQYCPMAKKSWLNEVEAVQNPFYGSMMYDCGEVTETLVKK